MRRRIFSIVLCLFLIINIALFTACGGTVTNSAFQPATGITLSEDNAVAFRDHVHIAPEPAAIQKGFKKVYINSRSQYTLEYARKLPDFFASLKAGDIFCIYPDSNAEKSFFHTGFCGKIIRSNSQTPPYSVAFEIPKTVEVFKQLRISTETDEPKLLSFQPSTGLQASAGLLTMGDSGPAFDLTIPLKDASLDFQYFENDRTALIDDFQILCRQLKIHIQSDFDSKFNLNGDIVLDYPSLKLLLDYSYDETRDEVYINDFEFDFITRETIDLTFSGTQKLSPFSKSSDLPEKISPINIVDVTESEDGKCVLDTLLIGYEVQLPKLISPQNKDNGLSYLSLGIAVQLAVTAAGELTMECQYNQAALLSIHADPTDCESELKGYDYPHPVIENMEPDGSWEQETPRVSSSYRGELSFDAGLSVDVGLCIFGMIPMKLSNGIEASYQASFDNTQESNEDKKQIIENAYIIDQSLESCKIDVYSTLKFHIGASIKGIEKLSHLALGAEFPLWRKTLYQIPEPRDFTLSECCFGGIQLGQQYSDEELQNAMKTYQSVYDEYSYIDYSKDQLINRLLQEALASFGDIGQAVLEEFSVESKPYKLDCYPSGAIYLRDKTDRVTTIILTGDKIRNTSGFHVGLNNRDISGIYANPDQQYNVQIDLGILVKALLNIEVDNFDLQGLLYVSQNDDVHMEIISESEESKIAIISLK